MRVKIKQLPKKAYGGQQAGGALNVTPNDFNGNYSKAKEGREVKQSLISVPRSSANLEAEGGETAFGPISGDTIPDHFKITGPRHHSGGVPLNLPEDTFIFSDTKAMKITDPSVLKMFGKTPKKGGYTPAELAKPYDINSYKAILMDPDSDRKSKETATLMIKNYIMKLGALALAQESKKGFPQGIPEMARPYMEANNITDEDLIVQEASEGAPAEQPLMKNGGLQEFKGDDPTKGSSVIANSLNDYNTWNDQSAEQQALAEYNKYMNRTNDLNVSALVNYTPNLNDPVYQAILKKYKGQSNQRSGYLRGYNMQSNLDPYEFYGNSGFINNSNGNFYNSNSNAEIFPFYNTGNAGRYNLDFSNPFSNRAFRRAGNYLTPMGASRITGPGFDNIPISGFPQDAKLTSIDYTFKKNPLLKALLNRDIARKELAYKYNFNGDLSKFTDDVDIEDVETYDVETNNVETDNVETEMSNRDFVNKYLDANDRYDRINKRAILKNLNKGISTQEEFLANREFINNRGENVVDSEELDENVDTENVDTENVEVENEYYIDDVPQFGGLILNNPLADKGPTYRFSNGRHTWQDDNPNMQKAFGGENQMLNTFVYGGNYVHGGFHSPVEQDEDPPYGGLVINNPMVDINDGMNNGNLTTDYANAGSGQLTADLIDNQSDKDAVAKILNINDNKEEEEEDSFSIEGKQKINTAWDFNPEDFRQQGLYAMNLVTGLGNKYLDAKEKESRFNLDQKKKQDAYVSQGNFYGTELANEEGVFATAAVSNPNMGSSGTTIGQFGGSISMAKYGANMGGSYYPTMSTGGSSRVRIKSLPSKDGGGTPGHTHPHSSTTTYIGGSPEWAEWYSTDNSKDYRTSTYNAYKARRDAKGNTALDEDSYYDIFNRAQRQIYGMREFYKDNPEYLNTKDWDSNYAYKDGKKDLSVDKGKNWKYKETLKEMNDKLRADNPNISQEELDKMLYTELTNDEISNFQSAYIAGKQLDASGGKTGDALTKYIHTGVNDQKVEMPDGTVVNISPEDERWGNTTNQELVTNRIGEKGELDTSTGLINCVCYPLDPETGLEDKSKPAISTTQIKEGEDCPDCSATITQKEENSYGDTPDEPYRYSRQDGRNLLTAARYETEAARISPSLINNQEISPVLVNPYTGDITAQIKAGMTGINTGGGSTAMKQGLRMQMLGKGTEATGGRYATTRDKNAATVNQAQQFNVQTKSQTDARNQQARNTANVYNAGADDKSLQARNAKLANMNLTEQAANARLGQKAMNNLFNPNMKISYSNDLPYFSAKYRDAMLNPYVTANNTDVDKTKTKTKNSKYGGSVNSNTFIPRYTTMPYDN